MSDKSSFLERSERNNNRSSHSNSDNNCDNSNKLCLGSSQYNLEFRNNISSRKEKSKSID